MVLFMLGEADDFILERGTVAGADSLDEPVVHRRLVEIVAHDPGGLLVGVRQIAWQIFMLGARADGFIGKIGEPFLDRVRSLKFHIGEINGICKNARRRSGFEPPDVKLQLFPDRRGKFR